MSNHTSIRTGGSRPQRRRCLGVGNGSARPIPDATLHGVQRPVVASFSSTLRGYPTSYPTHASTRRAPDPRCEKFFTPVAMRWLATVALTEGVEHFGHLSARRWLAKPIITRGF